MAWITFDKKIYTTTLRGKPIARGNYKCPKTGKDKKIQATIKGDKPKDVQAAKSRVRDKIEKILNQTDEPKSEKTFNDLADYFTEHHAVEAVFSGDVKVAGMKTWKNVRHDIKTLRKYFGKMLIKDINRDDVKSFRVKELKRKVRRVRETDEGEKEVYYKDRSLASVHHVIRTMQSMFRAAEEIRWLDRLPSFKGLASLATEKKREIIPTSAEFTRLLDESYNSRQPLLPVLLLFIADCGARPTEVYNLLWSDVDLAESTVVLTSDKGKRRTRRTIGLTDRLKNQLLNTEIIGEKVLGGIKSVKNSWNKCRSRAGCKHFDLYSLRHLYISRLELIEGLSDFQRMMLAGHSQPSTRGTYVKITPETLHLASKSLSDQPYISDAVN